jgi:hypothetical protein
MEIQVRHIIVLRHGLKAGTGREGMGGEDGLEEERWSLLALSCLVLVRDLVDWNVKFWRVRVIRKGGAGGLYALIEAVVMARPEGVA